jgi:hypothetical protein
LTRCVVIHTFVVKIRRVGERSTSGNKQVMFMALCATAVAAHQGYQTTLPNGPFVMRLGVEWPGVGHEASAGGGPRNPFGADYVAHNREWSTELCQLDSDGDGYTNGQELGDPDCVWSIGTDPARIDRISHPGFNDSTPETETGQGPRTSPSGSALPRSVFHVTCALLAFFLAA